MALKVVISGGGIAGPSLAFWLARLGYHCTILERFPQLRTGGQQIDLKVQAIDAVERMGLLDRVRKESVDEVGLQLVDSSGNTKALFPKEENAQGQGFTSEFEIMRGDLCNIIYDATKENSHYRFGVFVESFQDEGSQVRVKLSDGSEDTYDLLVAADGQESRIRKTLLGDETDKASRYPLNMVGCFYHIERPDAAEQIATAYVAPKRRVLTTRWHTKNQGQAYLVTMANVDEMKKCLRKDIAAQKDAFAKEFQDSGWEAQQLIDDMYKADDFYAQEVAQVRSPIWSKGRVVLLGDAGYAPTPITGMGTSLAILGAYVLAGELSRNEEDIPKALEIYETIFKPFVETTQNIPKGVPGILYPESAWGVKVIQGIAGFASAVKLNKLFAFLGSFNSKGGWELPPTPERRETTADSIQGGL